MSMKSFRERFRASFRSSRSSTTSGSTDGRKISRRSSIFDLLYLLKRGSSTRLEVKQPEHEVEANKPSEQEAFAAPDGEIEDDRQLSREKLLEKIREKKAVIEKLRCQPWPMRRKRRTLNLAQKYLQRHESKVSKTHLLKEEFTKKWKKFKRWLTNISVYIIPWEAKIKTIESHFGSVVSSYFTFLRWLFWVNVIMSLLMVSFIVIPECLADTFPDERRRQDNDTIRRKRIDPEEISSADYFQTVWDYKGHLTVSPLFYGYYSNSHYILTNFHYQLPLAYFLVNLFTLGYSFFAILRRMASNTRLSKLTSGKTEQYPFAWKLFTGWDYTIGNADTAANTVMANANKFRESIMEFKIKQKENFAWVLFFMRIIANILILGMIASSTYAVYYVVDNTQNIENPTAFEQNQVAIVISFITLVFPNFFELISRALERFHPRTALRVHLGRVLALYLLNFYTLIIALFTNITRIAKKVDDSVNITTTELPGPQKPEALTMDRESSSLLSTLNDSSINRYRIGRSPFDDFTDFSIDNSTMLAVAEPMLQLTKLLLSNVTSGAVSAVAEALPALLQTGAVAAITVTASTPIPPLIHLLKKISPTEKVEFRKFTLGNSILVTRMIRQTDSGRGAYNRYRVDGVRRLRTTTTTLAPVTGPLLWTTILPDVGTVGVRDADAFLKENISEWLRLHSNDLETFPPYAWKNGTLVPGRPGGPAVPGGVGPPDLGTNTDAKGRKPGAIPGISEQQVGAENGGTSTVAIGSTSTVATQEPIGPVPDIQTQTKTEKLSIRERRLLCWETWVGQEIAKLITMDLVMTIASILVVDFFRGLWVRYCNRWWCWNLETVFPEYGEFKVAENVLHIINNQGMIWLGLFFAPLLPVMNIVKLIIIMYIRAWACMTCNVPATQVFRASRSNNFYLLLLLLMLFLCTLPVGYVIAKQMPSSTCGPFSYNKNFYNVITDRLRKGVPDYIWYRMENLASPGIVIPVLVLLALIIYFLVSLIRGLREANQDLQKQLVHERTEEKRKIYQLAGGGKNHKSGRSSGRSSFGLPETKKVDLSYLPTNEKKKREAWRSKAPLSDDESLLQASDNEMNTQSPSSEGTIPATPVRPGMPEFPPVPAMGASQSSHFVPSLKSLPEEGMAAQSEIEDGDDDDRQKLLERSKSETFAKPKPNIIDSQSMSKSTPETSRRYRQTTTDKNNQTPGPSTLINIPESGEARFSLLGRQSPAVTTPLLSIITTSPSQSHSTSSSSSRSHSPLPPRNMILTTTVTSTPQHPPVPGPFPDSSLTLTRTGTPASESWSPTPYDNNFPTPHTPLSPGTSSSASSKAPFSDLTAKQVTEMLSPTKFSPKKFQDFMTAPLKKKATKPKATSEASKPTQQLQQAHVLIHMSDTENEKHPSDNGRASMTGSGDQARRGVSGAETDTGTESEMERFAKSRLRGAIDRAMIEIGDHDRRSTGRKREPPPSSNERKTFPRPMTSDFVPWPSPDPLAPKSILKPSGPPGRRDSIPAVTPSPSMNVEPSISPRRRFTLSVSPASRVGDSAGSGAETDGDASPSGRKRYIIRQTPSPSPKLRRSKMDADPTPTKLSVVSEVTLLPRLATMPAVAIATAATLETPLPKTERGAEKERTYYFRPPDSAAEPEQSNYDQPPDPRHDDDPRFWARGLDNNNKPSSRDRRSRAQVPSRSQLAGSYHAGTPLTIGNLGNVDSGGSTRLERRSSGSSSNGHGTCTSTAKKHPSKETVI